MSHAARINALAESLVHSFAPNDADIARNPGRYEDTVVRGLRSHQHPRTNHFDVHASLNGLIEKFQILHRDDLADALSARLKELSKVSTRWTPEILSLFLHLSDRPVEKSNVNGLELLKPPEPPPHLTWAEIIADDPLDEGGIWDIPKYDAETSEDEISWEEQVSSNYTEVDPPSSVFYVDVDPQNFIELPDQTVLEEVEAAQFWRLRENNSQGTDEAASPYIQELTELQAVREVLFMLRGLPTTLFNLGGGAEITPRSGHFGLATVSPNEFQHQLGALAVIGSAVHRLRQWTQKGQSAPLLQTFQAAVIRRCQQFDRTVATLEKRFLTSTIATTVSLMEVDAEVQSTSSPLLRLAQLIVELPPASHAFAYLETLYDHVCSTHMVGEVANFEYLAKLFFECLQTYLKPIRRWMDHGELEPHDELFFISETGRGTEPSSLWHERYALRHADCGAVYAPKFLHPAAQKILNAGKSVVFLRHLGHYDFTASLVVSEPRLDLDAVCHTGDTLLLVPFSKKFETAFDDWIRSKYHVASAKLCQHLFTHCGLWRALDALEYVYFSKDGSLFQIFAESVFEKLDGRRHGWNDRFLLTELVQSTFSSLPCIDQERLTVRAASANEASRGVKVLSSIMINYMLPWPVQNVVRRRSTATYQLIFTFLMQVYRSKYLLRQKVFQPDRVSLDTSRGNDSGYLLRYRLIWFTNTLHSYLTEYVLAPSTAQMRMQLADAEDIDAMIAVCERYITQLQSRCLLAKNLAPINQAITSVLDLCVLFCDLRTQQEANAETAKLRLSYAGRRRSTVSRLQRMKVTQVSDSSSRDEDEVGHEYNADTEIGPVFEGSYGERIDGLRGEFDRLCAFISAGLRGVSRVGGEQCWEMLAERLEWQTGRTGL